MGERTRASAWEKNEESAWTFREQVVLAGAKGRGTCFNHDTAWSDVEPRGNEGDVGEVKDLCPVR